MKQKTHDSSEGNYSLTQNCIKCKSLIPDGSVYCPWCGKKQIRERSKRVRGNGQGTVRKTAAGHYMAIVTTGYIPDVQPDGTVKRKRQFKTKTFATKKEAVAALPALAAEAPKAKAAAKKNITLYDLYQKWLPTHEAGKSTMDCYKAAFNWFKPLWFYTMDMMDIDELQDCMPDGKKRTQQNMKAVLGLVYKYGIPRGYVPDQLNLAQFLKVSGDDAAHRESFNDIQLEQIRKCTVYGTDFVYCLCYMGFRPSEWLSIKPEQYDVENQTIRAGAKTEAGKNRLVPVPVKIQNQMKQIYQNALRTHAEALICDSDGHGYSLRGFTENVFYSVLEASKIDNPVIEIAGGVERHKYTPHSCRHTYATLLKRTAGADADKLKLIGHTSSEMLRYYQDTPLEDLRKIANAL